jgi:hypothetical protein
MRKYVSKKPTAQPAPVTFDLDETTYICRELGPLELSEIARLHNTPADSPEAMAFMAEFFEMILGASQYRDFRRNSARFETQPEVFVEIIQGIFEDMTNRPTVPPSDSSDGRENTGTNSTADSSSRAMELLQGRPDLQQAVLQAQKH